MVRSTLKAPGKIDSTHKIKQQSVSVAMKKALISLGLEGISLSKESLSDLHLFELGKITKQETLNRVLARAKSAKK